MLKRKQNLLLVFLTMWCIALPAQETTKQQHTFSFHTGYGNMLKGTAGLTNSSKSYERSLSEGVSWDAQYYYRPADIVGIGFLFPGKPRRRKRSSIHTLFCSPGRDLLPSDKMLFHSLGCRYRYIVI